MLPIALKSRILLKPFLVLWKLTKKKKANLIKARFNTKEGPDLAFLQKKNFQDQMAYGVHFPKESLWNQQLGEGARSLAGRAHPDLFLHTEACLLP